jgi:hypothetical protein
MTEIKYEVTVNEHGTCWRLNDKLHREDGPAIEYVNGDKAWWLNDDEYTKSEFKKEMARRNKPSCEGKVVEIDGKKYTLKEVK